MVEPAASSSAAIRLSGGGDRSARALHALLELARALNSEVDLDSVLAAISERACEVMDAESSRIFLFDPSRQILWSRTAKGPLAGITEIPLGRGITGEAARTRAFLNVPDPAADPRFHPEADQRGDVRTRSLLAAPILDSRGQLAGVLTSMNKRSTAAFDEADLSLIEAVASHAAVALERARFTAAYLENERLAEGLKLASEIQMRMLPVAVSSPGQDLAFEVSAYIRPAKLVGGDLYDFELGGSRMYFCLGDVSGKGIGSALVMALTKTLFRANVPFYDDVAKLTEVVNVRLCEDTGPTMFVTAFCGFVQAATGEVHFCNAGHDRPFILRSDGSVELLDSKPGLALGVLPKFQYKTQQLTLGPDDALFLYTDGVTEAINAQQELFSAARLRQALERCAGESALRVVADVTEAVERFVEGAPQADDITMMCIRFRGPQKGNDRQRDFRRHLDALPEVMRALQDFFEDRPIRREVRNAVELALEEFFVNLVHHNPQGEGPIRIDFNQIGQEINVQIIDPDTDPFDPRAMPEVDVGQSLAERTPGGLGIHLAKKMLDGIDYSHAGGVGTVTLRKRMN